MKYVMFFFIVIVLSACGGGGGGGSSENPIEPIDLPVVGNIGTLSYSPATCSDADRKAFFYMMLCMMFISGLLSRRL